MAGEALSTHPRRPLFSLHCTAESVLAAVPSDVPGSGG